MSDDSASKFSEREMQLMGKVILSIKNGPPEVDYDKLASLTGMTNPRSAANAWNALKKKIFTDDARSAASTPAKRGRKPAAAAAAKAGDEDNDDAPKTTTPSKRKGAAAKGEGEGTGSPTKRGRKSAAARVREEEEGKREDSMVPESEATTVKLEQSVPEEDDDEDLI